MLSPRNAKSCGLVSITASQIGCGLSCLAHDPNAMRDKIGSPALAEGIAIEKDRHRKQQSRNTRMLSRKGLFGGKPAFTQELYEPHCIVAFPIGIALLCM